MTDAPLYLSQSECADWLLCPFKAHSRYVANYRPGRDETMPQRVGSIGHAILAEWARARFVGRPPSIIAAVQEEMVKRGWDGVDEADFTTAEVAATAVAAHLDVRLGSVHLAPDLWSGKSGPLADVVVRVPWYSLREVFVAHGLADLWRMWSANGMTAVKMRYEGIEGHPDLVAWPDGPGGPLVVYDWKFRQHIDLGGADGEVQSEVPDRQFAWYGTLLRAAGLAPAGGIELWQVNAYAGRWATVEDFIRVAQGGAANDAEAALVTQHGLPTRDTKRLDAAGLAVTVDVWAEAHRHLANVRHADRMDHWRASCRTLDTASAADGRKRKPPPRPDLLSYAERDGFDRFMADLRTQQPVIVRKMRSEPVVCLEVVRDMIVGVEGPLRLLAAGLPPARHLQSWPRSACSRPFGCAVQPICLPTLGTFRGAEESVRRAAATRLPVYDSAGNLSAEASS
jgi:hypothetical protein